MRHARLTQLYRRSDTSQIALSAHQIRAGHVPLLSDVPRNDFRFIEAAEPAQALARVVKLVAQELSATLGVDPFTNIQVLVPLNIGPLGTQGLQSDSASVPEFSGALRATLAGERVSPGRSTSGNGE